MTEIADPDIEPSADVFRMGGERKRLAILAMLEPGEMHVGAICTRLGDTQAGVSHILALLRLSGMVDRRREGKHNFYSLTPKSRVIVNAARELVALP